VKTANLHWRKWQLRHLCDLLLIFLLIAGLVIRCWRLDLMLFDFDEGIASIYARQFVQRLDWPDVGVKTSLGFYNPPLFIYLVSPSFLMSLSPVIACAFLQAIVCTSAAFLTFELRRARWSAGALVFVILFIASPGPLLLGRRLWGHSLIPACGMLVFAMLLRLVRRPRDRAASFMLLPVICAALQCHFSGILFLFSGAISVSIARIKLNYRAITAGAIAAALLYLPYLPHLVETHGMDLRIIANLVLHGSGSSKPLTGFYSTVILSLFDFNTNTAMQSKYALFLHDHLFFRIARGIAAIGLFLCITAWIFAAVRKQLDAVRILAAVFFLVPLIVFSLLRVEIVPAYWLAAFPGPWLLAGSVAEMKALRPVAAGTAIFLSAAGLLCFAQVLAVTREARVEYLAYPSYSDQRNAAFFISDVSTGLPARITQEARSSTAGIDYQLLYLLAWRDGDASRFDTKSNVPPSWRFVVHNRAIRNVPGLVRGLAKWRFRDFGLLRVYFLSTG
jgi:hypothetical protein